MINVILDIIIGSKQIDLLMHVACIFDNSKCLFNGDYIQLPIECEIGELKAAIEIIKTSFEKADRNVIFIGSKDYNEHYIKSGVSMLSTGYKTGLFKDTLKQIGYNAICDNNMKVMSVDYDKVKQICRRRQAR